MSVKRTPRLLEVFAVLVVDDFALVLGGDPGEELALGLGDAQLLVGLLHALGEHVPVGDLPLGGLEVVVDVVEVDVGHVLGEPLEHRLALEALQRVEPELGHPLRLALLVARCPGRRPRSGPSWACRRSRRCCRTSRACTCRDRSRKRPCRTPSAGGSRHQGFAGISTTSIVTIPWAIPNPGPAEPAARPCRTAAAGLLHQRRWASFTRRWYAPRSLSSSAAVGLRRAWPPPG